MVSVRTDVRDQDTLLLDRGRPGRDGVVIAVRDPAADLIGGAVALGALVVAMRSGIRLAGDDGAPDDEPPPADLTPRPRRTVRRP
jgi:hypothetical protein